MSEGSTAVGGGISGTASGSGRRRRGAELDEAIIQAAAEEMIENGFGSMTMDRVAARSGTNKNAIYRRFKNRIELGVAAYGRLTSSIRPPDTGTLREDVLVLLEGANDHWSSPLGAVLRDLISAAGGVPEMLATLGGADAVRADAPWMEVLERAVERGEAPSEALHPRVATIPIVLLRNEFVTRGSPSAPPSVLVEIVDDVYLPLVRGRRTPA